MLSKVTSSIVLAGLFFALLLINSGLKGEFSLPKHALFADDDAIPTSTPLLDDTESEKEVTPTEAPEPEGEAEEKGSTESEKEVTPTEAPEPEGEAEEKGSTESEKEVTPTETPEPEGEAEEKGSTDSDAVTDPTEAPDPEDEAEITRTHVQPKILSFPRNDVLNINLNDAIEEYSRLLHSWNFETEEDGDFLIEISKDMQSIRVEPELQEISTGEPKKFLTESSQSYQLVEYTYQVKAGQKNKIDLLFLGSGEGEFDIVFSLVPFSLVPQDLITNVASETQDSTDQPEDGGLLGGMSTGVGLIIFLVPISMIVGSLITIIFTRRGGGSRRKVDSTFRRMMILQLENLLQEKFGETQSLEKYRSEYPELVTLFSGVYDVERLEFESTTTSKKLRDLQLEKLERDEAMLQIESDINSLESRKSNLKTELGQRNTELNRIVGDVFVRNIQKDLDSSAYSGILTNVSDNDMNVLEIVRAVAEDGALKINFKFEPEIRDKMLIIPLADGTVDFISRESNSGQDFSEGIEQIIRSLIEGVITRGLKSRLVNNDVKSFKENQKILAGYYERNESPAPGIVFMLMTLANQFRNSLGVYASDLLFEHYENNKPTETWSVLSDKLAESSDALIDRINTIYDLMQQTPNYLDGLNGALKPAIQSNLSAESLVSRISNIVSPRNIDDILDELSDDLHGTIENEQRKLESLQNKVRREYWEYLIRRVSSLMADNPVDEYNALADVILAQVVYEYFDMAGDTFR